MQTSAADAGTRRRGLARPLTLGLVGGGAGAVVLLAALMMGGDGQEQVVALAAVERGPLTITVAQSGTIQNRRKEIVKSQVQGRATILWIIEEGQQVKAGDLLVELDSSDMEDNKIEQEIRVENAEAALTRSQENYEITVSQGESDVEQATLNKEFAELDLRKYLEAEYDQDLKEANNAVTIASEELTRAQNEAAASQRLFEKQYVTKNEMDADILSAKKAELQLQIARTKLDVLVNYTHPRQKRQLESDVKQKTAALERAIRKAKANKVQAEAELRAKQQEFDRQTEKLENLVDQIAKCRIRAPVDGMVIYATTGQSSRWRGNDEPLAEGQDVRERQELIHLPTANQMMAEIKVHEAALEKVEAGMPVVITTDALPGRSFTGKVAKIGLLPDAQMIWLNPDLKVYSSEVWLDTGDAELRAGMSCRAEIVVAHYDEALYVPLQSVLRVDGVPTAYVWNGKAGEPRPVKIGLDNGRVVRVLEGLAEGEQVMMTPPLAPSSIGERGNGEAAAGIAAVRDQVANKPDDDPDKPKKKRMDPEDARVVAMLQQMKQRNALRYLRLDEEAMAKVESMLAKLEAGEEVELDSRVRSLIKARMNAMRQRREDRRPESTPE